MRPDDIELEQLKDDLLNYRADLEAPGLRAQLIETALPRILATLEMIPDSMRSGDFLELGATPFFLTLCLRRLCTGRIALANWFGTSDAHGTQRLTHAKTGHELHLQYDLFNVETDAFPHPDEGFDVVIFSELIEHLGVNPVRTLAEMHRVLRPGGYLIVTTPNALSLERLESYLLGGSQMVDRYSPLFGYGARHNREYHPEELRELLEGCGFTIEDMTVRDLVPHTFRERLRRAAWRRFLARYSTHPREEHIFLRARRGDRFRWSFPARLFDNTEFYILIRYPWVEMGINESIQSGEGWYPLEAKDGKAVRRIRGVGQAFLKSPAGRLTFGIDWCAAPADGPPVTAHIIVWDRWLGRVKPANVYVEATVPIERGRWQRIELPLQRHPRPGDEVEVRIAINGDARSSPPILEPSEPARGVAVHKLWFDAR